MRSPADMEFIQIDITNACNMRCSNCTRFCGNHEKPFFMDFDTFRRAVDSLDAFDGVTGIIGGEPTLHPEFERFALYLQEKFGKPSGRDVLFYPQKDFIHAIHQREFESSMLKQRMDGSHFLKKHGAGLWSNMSSTYRKYYEIIQDTFSVEYLNDHLNPSFHQPGLFSRKDLGISDEDWIPLRDRCWVQNTWSATITPKGAFFCEIAGALDMLFDGPGGWKIEPDWWKRKPEEFADQLHWCEFCGFALEGLTFTRDSQEEVDDVSPSLYERLKNTSSPKLKAGKINLVRITNGRIEEESKAEDKRFLVGDRYIAKYEDRFHEKNSILFRIDYKEVCIQDSRNFGQRLNSLLQKYNAKKDSISGMYWIVLKREDSVDTNILKSVLEKQIFNPGCLHLGDGYLFFCNTALSLRKIGFDRIAHMTSADELIEAWSHEKVIHLVNAEEKTTLCRPSIHRGERYGIWGAGMLGEFFAETVEMSGGIVSLVVDKAFDKIGKSFAGTTIEPLSALMENAEAYDYLLLAHHLQFEEMEREALEMGVSKKKIILPYEV